MLILDQDLVRWNLRFSISNYGIKRLQSSFGAGLEQYSRLEMMKGILQIEHPVLRQSDTRLKMIMAVPTLSQSAICRHDVSIKFSW